MLSPREIDLYIENRDCSCRDIQTVCVTQYDNYVPLQIRVYEQKNNKKIPLAIPSGYTAYFNVAHSNGDTSYLNCIINDDSTLTVKLTNTTLSTLGRDGCQVVFVGSDESRFSSEIFYLQIGKTLSDDDAVEGTPEFTYFVDQLAQMAQLVAEAQEAVAVLGDISKLQMNVAKNTASIKTIESKLAEANPNRDPRVSITSAAPSIDIPKTAAPGGVDVAIRGVTETDADGTKSAVAPRLRSVGRNIANHSELQQRSFYTERINPSYAYGIIKAKPNTTYRANVILTGTTQSGLYYAVASSSEDHQNTMIILNGATSSRTLTTNSDGFIYCYCVNTNAHRRQFGENYRLQIEEGVTTTSYEPYRESYLYVEPYTLRSLATGTCDEISEGRLVQRIAEDGTVLPTPIITENVTSGTLISYPGGTIYAEPALADAGVCDSGITVLNTSYPIKTLETISTIDFVTGAETPIDVSTATISSDGLSFTHTDIANGDIVFFTYFYDYGGVYGENTYSYLDSNHVKQDSVTGTFYKRDWEVVDGQYHIVLKEVQ